MVFSFQRSQEIHVKPCFFTNTRINVTLSGNPELFGLKQTNFVFHLANYLLKKCLQKKAS